MSVTAGELVNETISYMQTWSLDSEQVTTLGTMMSPTSTTFQVTDERSVALGISPGLIEIGSEMIFCATVDAAGNAVIPPWGRGYQNTTAAVHAPGDRVTSQPTFPRYWVLRAINESLERIFPIVFAVKQFETVTTYPSITYDLPAGAMRALDARWQVPSAAQYWEGVRNWRPSPGGGTLTGDTNVSIDIPDPMIVGRPLQIRYSAKPGQLVTEADDFETVTGLNLALRDVVCLGAAAALVPALELSKLQTSTVEQQERSSSTGQNAGLTGSNFLQQQFLRRLAEERTSQQALYPMRITGGWI